MAELLYLSAVLIVAAAGSWAFMRQNRRVREMTSFLGESRACLEKLRHDNSNLLKALEAGSRRESLLAEASSRLREGERILLEELDTRRSEISCLTQEVAQQRQHEVRLKRLLAELESNEKSLIEITEGLQEDLTAAKSSYEDMREKLGFIQQILGAVPPERRELVDFETYLLEQYLPFAERESSLANEAGALLNLQRVQNELNLLANFPAVYGKRIVAVAGGFSTGKSAFINSLLLNGAVELAVGLKPITAVPSFVVAAETPRIRGYTRDGAILSVSTDIYKKMSHDFMVELGFDLRRFMPYVSVETTLPKDSFANMALLDTPGYNPGSALIKQSFDRALALEHISRANALIWVVGLDSTGTLPQSDVEFLQEVAGSRSTEYPLDIYIVLNKADLKAERDIQLIIEVVQDTLESSAVPFVGIAAYSASQSGRMLPYINSPLTDFLRSQNRPVDMYRKFRVDIDAVFDGYSAALRADWDRARSRKINVNRHLIRTLGSQSGEEFEREADATSQYLTTFPGQNYEALLQECETLRAGFHRQVRRVLDSVVP